MHLSNPAQMSILKRFFQVPDIGGYDAYTISSSLMHYDAKENVLTAEASELDGHFRVPGKYMLSMGDHMWVMVKSAETQRVELFVRPDKSGIVRNNDGDIMYSEFIHYSGLETDTDTLRKLRIRIFND